MNMSQEQVIFCRIVANLLYKKIQGISVSLSNSPLHDLIIEEKSQGLFFAVKVADMDYPNSPEYQQYLATLNERSYWMKDERLPIILMCADKNTETIRFGYQLTWQRYRATIHTKVTLRDVTEQSWSEMIENLKEMDKVIRVLDNQKISIVKRIAVERQIPTGGMARGEIIYLRKFTNSYKMQQKEVSDEQEKFRRMVFGIPEEEYPNDILDEIIMRGIEGIFPGARRKSQILLLNTELQDLKSEQERTKKEFRIRIEPDFNDLVNYQGIINSFRILEIPLTLYHDPIRLFGDNLRDEFTSISMPVVEWIESFGNIEKLLRLTLQRIDDVVTEID